MTIMPVQKGIAKKPGWLDVLNEGGKLAGALGKMAGKSPITDPTVFAPPPMRQPPALGAMSFVADDRIAAPRVEESLEDFTRPVSSADIAASANLPEGIGKQSVWDKIGGFLNKPGVSGALLRSGAATLQGGLGAGINAATAYMDQRKAQEEGNQRWGAEFGLKQEAGARAQQEVDQTGIYQAAQIDNMANDNILAAGKFEEAVRSNKVKEYLDTLELKIRDAHKRGDWAVAQAGMAQRAEAARLGYASSIYSSDVSRANSVDGNATQRRGQEYGFFDKMAPYLYPKGPETTTESIDESGVKTTTKNQKTGAPLIEVYKGSKYFIDPVSKAAVLIP